MTPSQASGRSMSQDFSTLGESANIPDLVNQPHPKQQP